jgi:protein-tyrosine phosphatase
VSDPRLHVTFVCSGNISRSPMADRMFARQIDDRGLSDAVRVSSAGTGTWHAGEPAHHHTVDVLRENGYPTDHRAAALTDDHLAADVVVAMGRNHARILGELGVPADRLRLMRSFDPRSEAHPPDVEDPYYGTLPDYRETFAVIDAALPGLHAWVDHQLAERENS